MNHLGPYTQYVPFPSPMGYDQFSPPQDRKSIQRDSITAPHSLEIQSPDALKKLLKEVRDTIRQLNAMPDFHVSLSSDRKVCIKDLKASKARPIVVANRQEWVRKHVMLEDIILRNGINEEIARSLPGKWAAAWLCGNEPVCISRVKSENVAQILRNGDQKEIKQAIENKLITITYHPICFSPPEDIVAELRKLG